ncbi:heterokaryon incompatibility protein [Colletotrichum tofieldiae]|nr:heterokaryon incompatibility protein [Colletotrichum tofieldiae]GKT70475.1 heterokaryon incompatibility protein [Colletotrichum tofieldiae]
MIPYEYQPLHGEDIRVLSIEPLQNEADSSTPIRCTIEHISLAAPSRHPHELFKGHDNVWPETNAARDIEAIFKQPSDAPILSDGTTKCPPSSYNRVEWHDNDQNLPWRHDWGDFVALSYVWGPPAPTERITLNGHPFSVGPNLFQALLHLRSHHRIRQGFKIWIDAICINQADIAERSAQVGRMRDIYAAAWQVVIWLGPEADDSELATSALSWIAARNRSPDPYNGFYRESTKIDARPLFIMWGTFKSPLKKDVYKALFFYLSRPYWQRMWILQEVAMARHDAPIICGKSCLPWEDIHNAAAFISNDGSRFGRELVGSVRPRILKSWSFEFARDRVVREREWSSERMWDLLIDMSDIQYYQSQASDAKHDSRHSFDVLRPLILARDAKITEEKDRVYGILGIRAIADQVHVIPDYELSLSAIYRDFTAQLVSKGDLEILRFVSRGGGLIRAQWDPDNVPSAVKHRKAVPIVGPMLNLMSKEDKKDAIGKVCTHELPTWTVCWTCKPPPTAQLRGRYCAGGAGAAVPPLYSPIDHSLIVKGVIFDTIGSLSAFHPAEVDDYPQNGLQISASAYGSLEDTRTAFWRTLLGDTTAKGGSQAPETGAWLLTPQIWDKGVAGVYTNGFGLQELMIRNKKLVLSGYTLEQLIFGVEPVRWRQKMRSSDRIYNPTEEQREVLSWAMNATAWRRLISTTGGRVGLAPVFARAEDRIVCLRGCSTPMVLRPLGNRWEVIGECYVHGAMYGELWNKGPSQSDVVLC